MLARNTSRRSARRRHQRRGFTLLEIIVVVTIIALLGALVAPKVLSRIGGAKTDIAKSEVATIAQQINLWMADQQMSRLPDDFDLELLATGDNRTLELDDIEDPWGNRYVVIVPGDINVDFDVVSYGADGQPGGEGEDEDVVN